MEGGHGPPTHNFNMAAKRKLNFTRVTDMPMNKRLRRVERQVRLNRPEMKHITISASGTVTAGSLNTQAITNIAQGDLINERSGDRIRVWRVVVRGLASSNLDNYLIQQHTTTLPTVADFNSGPGAFTLDSQTNTRFTEWKHYRGLGSYNGTSFPLSYQVKFRNGIVVKYGGTGPQAVDNGLVTCQLNRTTSDSPVGYTIRVYFTDA